MVVLQRRLLHNDELCVIPSERESKRAIRFRYFGPPAIPDSPVASKTYCVPLYRIATREFEPIAQVKGFEKSDTGEPRVKRQ
jgi:hypothetical protein